MHEYGIRTPFNIDVVPVIHMSIAGKDISYHFEASHGLKTHVHIDIRGIKPHPDSVHGHGNIVIFIKALGN